MRVTPGLIANALGWGVIAALIAGALLIAGRLGFLGLFLLGVATWLVASRACLDEDAPGWGQAVFAARLRSPARPEERAALRHEHDARIAPLRFARACGVVLTAIGAAGSVWQIWAARGG